MRRILRVGAALAAALAIAGWWLTAPQTFSAADLPEHEPSAAAGERMGISRGTVQRLVTCGRRKMVTAIIECSALVIETEEGEEQL